MIKAILFDLDDTLGDRKKSITNYAKQFIKKYCGQLSDAEMMSRLNLFIELDQNGYGNKYQMYDRLIGEWRLDNHLTPKILVDEWIENFYFSYVLFEDTEKMLKLLKSKYKLGLLTNGGSKSQRKKIEATGIEKNFDEIIVSKEIEIAKPNSEAYFMLCNQLNVLPEACIFVGDKMETDIIGAMNANITAVWINDEFKGEIKEEKYGFQINSVSKLPRLLEGLA